jgi:hypothetical protein
VDFAFSYLVLQHMPEKEVVFNSIREMMRILRPGGAFLFQFNGFDKATMNFKGRAVSSVLDNLASLGLKGVSQKIAGAAGIDPEMVGKTWRGVSLSADEITKAVQSGHASPEGFLNLNTPMTWCYGRKSPETSA